MTKSKRTHPLDRDGDGAPGGSLPGNGTAPMAEGEDGGDELADARTTPGDGEEKLAAIERETDEANARADQADGDASAVQALDQAFADDPDETDEDDQDDEASPTFEDDEVAASLNDESDKDDPELVPQAGSQPPETVQVAVSVRDLTILVGARRLYKSDEGYSSNYGAPYLSEATVAEMLKGGLAEAIPSAGISGGVKATAEARRQLGLKKREEQAA